MSTRDRPRGASALPPFNNARTQFDPTQLKPPFGFDGVTMRVLPLRSKIERAQAFIDSYVNDIIPKSVAELRVFLPYVYLMVIDYGKMSVNAANLGWISQHEVAFSVPLLWYKEERGKLVFHDYAYISPFIYVDNALSMTTGREVYGWPKDLVTLESEASPWVSSTSHERVLARFSAMIFPELYAGMRQAPHTLFDVRSVDGLELAELPFNTRAPALPWNVVPNSITSATGMMRDFMATLRGVGISQAKPGARPGTFAAMAMRAATMVQPYRPDLVFNTINLKQFRDAEDPGRADYQALTNARMRVRRIGGAGMLGPGRVMLGDASGGLGVLIHRHPTHPIVSALGIDVDEELTIAGRTVSLSRPVFPFWMSVDMTYDVGHVLAWRAHESHELRWRTGEGRVLHTDAGEDPTGQYKSVLQAAVNADDVRYNTARGAAETQITGPFEFPDVTLRVMPLLADEEKLAAFLDAYLGHAVEDLAPDVLGRLAQLEGIEIPGVNGVAPLEQIKGRSVTIRPWGRYVYLIATSYEQMSSKTNDIGWWAERDLIFYVPAQVRAGDTLLRLVLVPAYAFADSATAALTGAEVSGIPVEKASLASPSSAWMNDQGPSKWKRRVLLALRTTVIPAVELGQEAVMRDLVQVFEGDAIEPDQAAQWRRVADEWGATAIEDFVAKRRRKDGRAEALQRARGEALQLFTGERPFHILTLKQFRDAGLPDRAAYQAIVEIDRTITRVQRVEEIQSGLYVRLHHYPTHPIVETLGLVPVRQEIAAGGTLSYLLEPVRPFWIKASLREHLGRNLLVRSGGDIWEAPRRAPAAVSGGASPLDIATSEMLLRHEPRRLRDHLRRAKALTERRRDPAETPEARIARARGETANLVDKLDPQTILEVLLSEEWERWGEARWSEARERIERSLKKNWVKEATPEADEKNLKTLMGAIEEELTQVAFVAERRVELVSGALRCAGEIFVRRLLELQREAEGPKEAAAALELTGMWREVMDGPRRAHHAGPKKLLGVFREVMDERIEELPQSKLSPQKQQALARLLQEELMTEKAFSALAAQISQADTARPYITVREAQDKTLDQLLNILSKLSQKPHHAIRVAMIANEEERDRLFPKGKRWNRRWYVGKR